MTDLGVRVNESQLATAVMVLRVLDAESTTAQEVADALSDDPVLSRRLLRLARSPMFGVMADDLTVQRAVVLVGFSTVRSLAVLSAAKGLTAHDDGAERWVDALTTGIATEQLAARAGVDPGDGLVAGMLNRLVDGADEGVAKAMARSVPAAIVEAMRMDAGSLIAPTSPPLCRLVDAGKAVAALMIEVAPGIPSSTELAEVLETTTFPGLADRRLATDIRRGVDLYASLAD